ncbi:hypothetical protein Tco_1149480, partial [Tanacetum coccineum]
MGCDENSCNPELMVFHVAMEVTISVADSEILEVAAFGIHADNCHMVLQRFLIQEVWRWFHAVAVQSSGVTMTDLSRKLKVNFVKFKFRGGLLGIIDFVPSIVPAG